MSDGTWNSPRYMEADDGVQQPISHGVGGGPGRYTEVLQ